MYRFFAADSPWLTRLLVGVCWLLTQAAWGQAPALQWDRTFGGSDFDFLLSSTPTRDGGYLLGGQSLSGLSGERSEPSRGSGDMWVLKLDASGTKQWDHTFGGSDNEALRSVQQTPDGGYILYGTSASGVSGNKSSPAYGGNDLWLVKLDASGAKQWDHTFGGSGFEAYGALQQTPDGGYLVAGTSASDVSGNKTAPNRGNNDIWLFKLDANGTKQWDRTFGGTQSDEVYALEKALDGGYLLGGHSASGISPDKSQPSQGNADYWIIKLDASGNKQWDRTLGGAGDDLLHALQPTTDGGYLLGGQSLSGSSGDKSQPSRGNSDYWVLKVDGQGVKQWDQTLGGADYDDLRAVVQTLDGGYALAGSSTSGSSGDKTPLSHGRSDRWLVKLDALGSKQWDLALGGSGDEDSFSLLQNADGSYLIAGSSSSPLSGDKTQPSRGGYDYWVVKLAAPVAPPVTITGDSVLCVGSPGRLTALTASPASSYRWNTGATTASLLVTQGGTYSVQATYPTGLSATASYQVTVRPSSPLFSLGADTTLCVGQQVLLHAPTPTLPGLVYHWSDGSTGNTLPVAQPGTYTLTITGCDTRTASRRVEFEACPVLIPNILTVNGDALNERFVVRGLPPGEWALAIYNRWGRQVFSTSAYHNEWGRDVPPGVYYYLLHQPGTTRAYKGWVEVAH
jgi:hypothetical protein